MLKMLKNIYIYICVCVCVCVFHCVFNMFHEFFTGMIFEYTVKSNEKNNAFLTGLLLLYMQQFYQVV